MKYSFFIALVFLIGGMNAAEALYKCINYYISGSDGLPLLGTATAKNLVEWETASSPYSTVFRGISSCSSIDAGGGKAETIRGSSLSDASQTLYCYCKVLYPLEGMYWIQTDASYSPSSDGTNSCFTSCASVCAAAVNGNNRAPVKQYMFEEFR